MIRTLGQQALSQNNKLFFCFTANGELADYTNSKKSKTLVPHPLR
jgi:hypothetical protein